MKTPAKLTFVTVAHEDDYGLMRLQARSLSKYLDPDLAAEILVVENFAPGGRLRWRETLNKEYGAMAAKVRFVKASSIASISATVSGWFSQQILKLMVSSIVSTEYYVVLDGKNHLIRPLAANCLIGRSGKPRSYLMSYESHPMRPFLENTIGYFGLDPRKYIKEFLPTTTPFVIPTPLARSLVWHVEAREQRKFPEAFLRHGYNRSEFSLLGAYVLHYRRPLTDVYEFSAARNYGIWPENTAEECSAIMAANEAENRPFFAVHRRAIPTLSEATRLEIAEYWFRHGLFPSLSAAVAFLSNPRAPAYAGGV